MYTNFGQALKGPGPAPDLWPECGFTTISTSLPSNTRNRTTGSSPSQARLVAAVLVDSSGLNRWIGPCCISRHIKARLAESLERVLDHVRVEPLVKLLTRNGGVNRLNRK